MKTLRIVNEKGCVYVERNFFRRWWYRLRGGLPLTLRLTIGSSVRGMLIW